MDPPPTYSVTMQQPGLPSPSEYLRPYPFLQNRHANTQKKYSPNERTDQSSRKTQLNNEEIDNLSDIQFKTLIIRMLTEVIEYGRKREEKVKARKSKIKDNIQGTTNEGKKTGIQTNSLEQKKEVYIQSEQNEEIRI